MKKCYDCQNELTDLELRFNAAQEIKRPICFNCSQKLFEKPAWEIKEYAESYLNMKPCKGRNNLYKEWIGENE